MTSRGWETSYSDQIVKVVIEDGVTNIDESAFSKCKNIETLIVEGSTLTNVGDYACYGLTSLKSVTLPSSVIRIGTAAFDGCTGLTSITLPSGLKTIGLWSFKGSGLTSISIPATVTSIEKQAFDENENLKTATINGSNLTVNGFSNCTSLQTVTIKSGVTAIGDSAFYNCTSLVNLTIGENVTAIGYGAFWGCTALKSLTIPDSVTKLGNSGSSSMRVFMDCTSLETVVFGTGISSIPSGTFSNDTAIKYMYFCGDAPEFASTGDNFTGITATAYYPKGNTTWKAKHLVNHGGSIDWQTWTVPVSHFSAAIKSLTNTSKGIQVKWSKMTGATGYKVYRKTSSGSWKNIKTIKKGSTVTYTDTTAKAGTKYYYKVYAYDSSGTSGASSSLTTYRLKATTVSKVTNSAAKTATVTVKKSSKVTGYQVQYSTSKSFTSAKTKSSTKTTIKLTRLTRGKTYYVRVRTYRKSGSKKYYSAWSAAKKVKISK